MFLNMNSKGEENMPTRDKDHILGFYLNRQTPSIVKAEGVYLYDDKGNRIIDASGGAIICSIGHGVEEIVDIAAAQMKKVAYVFRRAFQSPELEEAASKVCEATNGDMDRVFFVSGGSEATETAVKLARKYHIDNGNSSKFRVISRWQSYHGATMGALSWSGFTSRRAEFTPYLNDFVHLPPTYCYRCWYGKSPQTCDLDCAQALENEILCLGPETVSAYIAEPVSGHALGAAFPPDEHFKKIRTICDKYDVLMILDEVMNGVGRTGKWFAYQYHGVVPDIIALAKGLSAGYYPVGAAVVRAKIHDTIAGHSGIFGSGHTYGGNPVAAAVVCRVIDYLRERSLVERCAAMGDYLAAKLETLKSHPTVGDVRGKGLQRGVEFVKNKATRETLDPQIHFSQQIQDEALRRGVHIESSFGCDRGQAGDMIIFGPPFIITEEQIDDIIEIIDETLTVVEKRAGF
jgi:adenosylmethionine-8-amino-7-oxononanoate aminotransferase